MVVGQDRAYNGGMTAPASLPLPTRRRFPALAYLQLLRLPNVFTALADVGMGFLVTHPQWAVGDGWRLGALLAASSSLYLAGMVLNDAFDREIDALERPERPLPSGRIAPATAWRLGWILWALGLVFAGVATVLGHDWRPGVVGLALAAAVVLYDGLLKRTPFGPLGMGACRLLNVLLGMSLAAGPWGLFHGQVALAVGTYITGVTWFARSEATESRRGQLAAALLLILAGIALLLKVPERTNDAITLLRIEPVRWPMLLGALGLIIGYRCLRAVLEPTPRRVQTAVRQCLLSLVLLDAAVTFVVWDTHGAVAVMLLLVPTVLLSRWVYST